MYEDNDDREVDLRKPDPEDELDSTPKVNRFIKRWTRDLVVDSA